jgi:hypothetical protein
MFEANLGGAFRLYRASLARSWLPALVLALCSTAASIALGRMMPATDDPWLWMEDARTMMMTARCWQLLFVAGAASVLCYGALAVVIHAVAVPGTAAPAAAGFGPALRLLPSSLVAAIIFLVATTLGTMAFFVPGAYLWGMWQLWLVALVVERLGPIAALRRSWQLMSGAWWRITTFITVVFIVVFLLAVMLYVIEGVILFLAGVSLAGASGIVMVVDAVAQLLLAPLVTAAFVVAYLDRLRAQAQPQGLRVGAS